MKYLIYIFILLAALWQSCMPVPGSSSSTPAGTEINKTLQFQDKVYEENIQTAILYPLTGETEAEILPAALPLRQEYPLVLKFDELHGEIDNYNVRIVHCNFDWTESSLNNAEFMEDFNEFPIRDYEASFNTRVPYIHYRFLVPRVKLPGNYLLVVYRGRNKNDIILSKRFIVFDQRVQVIPEIGLSSGIPERNLNQQINFAVNYGNITIPNPYEGVDVVIRQNQRWDNAIRNLKPTFVREAEQVLEYHHFDLENNFKGGNEFRFFDLRSIHFSGQNIGDIKITENRVDAFLLIDENRQHDAYGQHNDINGEFVVNNLEASPRETASEYVNVHFFLEAEQKARGNVYIAGELTNWEFKEDNLMHYNSELQGYTGSLFLKQGWYNYQYLVKDGRNPYLFEGSHFEAENQYEIIVYHRPPGARADLIVGYMDLRYNNRRN